MEQTYTLTPERLVMLARHAHDAVHAPGGDKYIVLAVNATELAALVRAAQWAMQHGYSVEEDNHEHHR